jgi:exodeoxyribonuclease III
MRLVTWNCNKGAYSKKVPLLDRLGADIAVVQECAKPADESDRCLWFGDKVNQGILVLAGPAYSIRRLPALDGVPKFVIPIGISGPGIDFTLLAVWAKGDSMPIGLRQRLSRLLSRRAGAGVAAHSLLSVE